MGVNDNLDTLYAATSSMNNAAMTQLIGKEVVAYGDEFTYAGSGNEELLYDCEGEASSATLNIMDEDGSVVYSTSLGALSEGEGSFTWDGEVTSGGTAEEGLYTFEVEATNTDGDSVTVYSMVHGVIDTMNYESGSPIPEIDGVELGLGDIIRVEEADSSEDTTDEDDDGSETA